MRTRLSGREFWTDSTLSLLPDSTRLLYIGLWCVADDAGYIEWDTDAIGHQLLGYRSPATRRRVTERAVEALIEAGRVRILDCGRHALIPTLTRHSIMGGRKNERVKKAHFEHGPVQVPDRPVQVSGKSRSESVSESESVSVRGRAKSGNDEYGAKVAAQVAKRLRRRVVTERESYRVDEVAELLGLHSETVRRWLQAGEMPGRKVRNTWLVPVTALRDWLHGEEATDGRRRDHLPAEVGRPLGGRHQPRSEGTAADGDALLPDESGGHQGARRAARRRRSRRCQPDGWCLPRTVGP